MIHAETQSSSPGPGIAAVSVEIGAHGTPIDFFTFLRLCVSACAFSFAQKAENRRFSATAYGLGAIQELRKMYTATVTVVK